MKDLKLYHLLITIGIIALIFSYGMDTSVETIRGDRVNNIGLMNDRLIYLVGSGIILIIGVILFVSNMRESDAPITISQVEEKDEYSETKECPACAETIKLKAKKCRFCGEIFDAEEVKSQIEKQSNNISNRIPCPDGTCIGIINEMGVCTRCGLDKNASEKIISERYSDDIKVTCPECDSKLKVDKNSTATKCPKCSTAFNVRLSSGLNSNSSASEYKWVYDKQKATGLILLGYITAVLGGYIGVITGFVLIISKHKFPDGSKVNKYEDKTRMHGRVILVLGISMALIWQTLGPSL